jgi:hypothetical protein
MRLIQTGDFIELYQYASPYFYNKPPPKKSDCPAGSTFRRKDNLSRARNKIRRVINANSFAYNCKPIFVTYTFADNVQDIEKANKLFTEHIKRFNYYITKEKKSYLKYMTVIEFQKRGAIHYHTLFFNLHYIPHLKNELSKLWGHGFVKVKTIRNVHNVGAYVSKYLRKETMDKRLVGQKAYFCSRRLFPIREYRNEDSIRTILQNYTFEEEYQNTYESSYYGRVNYKVLKQI